MPNIDPGFAATNLTLTPSETGVEATARAGVRLGAYGNQIAGSYERLGQESSQAIRNVGDAAVQYMEHREVNTGAKQGATLAANKNQQLGDFLTGKDIDPNDPQRQDKIDARINNPQAVEQWRAENLEPALDDFENSFLTEGGRQWAQHFVDTYRDHIVNHGHAIQSSMAGAVVQANFEKTNNTLAAATFNDPSMLAANFDLLAHSIEGNVRTSPTLSPEDATKVTSELTVGGKERLVQASIQGSIIKGGDWRSIANDPKYAPYVKPAENLMFERQEEKFKESTDIANKQTIILNKQIAENNAHASINQSWGQNVHFDDATGRVTINPQFVKDMSLLPFKNQNAPDAVEKARTMIDWAESQQKPPPPRDNSDVVSGLLKTVSDPTVSLDNAKTAIAKADIAKGITPETRGQITQLATDLRNVNDPFLKNAMEGVKPELEQKFAGVSSNPGAYAKFYYDFVHNYYLPQKVAGTLPANALDLSDPKSMISQRLSAAKGPPDQTMATTIGTNGGVKSAPSVANTPAEAAALPPGTHYRTPDGKEFVR